MAQIRDTDIIRTPEVTVDPRLFLPEGVIDMSLKSAEIEPDSPVGVPLEDVLEDDNAVDPSDVVYDDGSAPETDEGGQEEVDTLPTPQYILVLDQVVRFAPDGKALVDVTIEVEDIPGISNYEVRMTKV